MGFSKDKIKPWNDLEAKVAPIVFKSVRSTTAITSNRKRQCYKCMDSIKKGNKYFNHQYRYDGSIVTISFCVQCFCGA